MPERLLGGLPAALAGSGTVWLVLGLAVAWFLRRRPARAHSVLALAAAGALVTPLLVLMVQRANWGVLPATRAEVQSAPVVPRLFGLHPVPPIVSMPDREVVIVRREANGPPPPIVRSTTASPSWGTMIAGAWLLLSLGLGVRLVADIVSGWRAVRRSRPATGAALLEALRIAALRLGTSPVPRLHSSEVVASPALWGWSRPAVVLIPEAAELSGGCEAVFYHELSHLRRHDHWTALLAEVLVCALPWHPLAWLARREMSAFAEEACDDWVVACGCAPLEYAEALVGLTPTATPALTVAAVSRHSSLATRVRRLLAGGLRPPRLGRGWLAGATLGALLLAAAWALWQPRRAVADDPAAKAAPPSVARPGASRTMRVVILDPDGKPLPGANVHSSIWTEEKPFKANGDYKTDAAGAVRVELPGTYTIVRLWAWKPPLVSMFATWEKEELASGKRVPDEYTIPLEKGTTAGGRVVDEQGRPIAGAKVEVSLVDDRVTKPSRSDGRVAYNHWLAIKEDAAITDAEGRWRIVNVPDHLETKLSLLVTHPEYLSDQFSQQLQMAQGITTAMLLQGTATLTLKRGVIIEGRVTDPDGKPISNGLVIHGDDPYFASVRSDFPIGADGRFRLPALPPGERNVTVIAPGWAPQLRRVNLRPGLPVQEFRMTPGKPIRLRVVDGGGKPVPGAYVSIQSWKGVKSLHNHDHPNVRDTRIPRRTDDEGIWEWTWAPDDAVIFDIGKRGHAPFPLQIGGGGPTRTVVLKAEHRITGRVTDAMTGQPIPAFTVIEIDVFRKDFLHADRQNAEKGQDGRLNYLATRTDIPLRLRIDAEGHRTQDGPEFRVGDDSSLTQDFRLKRSRPIAGTVVDPSGRPLAKADVVLATPTQAADLVRSDQGNKETSTDDSGHFQFSDPGEPWAVIARGDAGYAVAEFPPEHVDAGELRLRPWASVRGRFVDGGKPVRTAHLFLEPVRILDLARPRIEASFQTNTGPDGRFEFPKVPPVPMSLRVYIGPWMGQDFRSGPSVPLDLQPGQRVELELGGGGSVVIGRVKLTGTLPPGLDCTYSLNYLVRREPGITPPSELAALGFDVRKGWRHTWISTAEGQAYMNTLQKWFVKLAPDGSFRVSGVPPGEYDLAVAVYEKPAGCLVDPLARNVVRVTVTEADVARGEMTLPEITAEVMPIPAVGDAPVVAFRRAEGAAGTLGDFRGKYTLVHFWASWCSPCKQQLPALRALHDRFTARGLATLGLSLDEEPAAWRGALEAVKLPWAQGRLASASQAGVSSVPAYWLLDPEGKIVAKASDPDELATALGERLK